MELHFIDGSELSRFEVQSWDIFTQLHNKYRLTLENIVSFQIWLVFACLCGFCNINKFDWQYNIS